MSDLINDHIEVFCGGGCLELLHTQHGGHSIGKESVYCRYRGGNAENKHQRQLTYVVPGKTFLNSIIKVWLYCTTCRGSAFSAIP